MVLFEMLVQREEMVSDIPPPEEISRRCQMLISRLLREHEILARFMTKIFLMVSGVQLCQSDAATPSLDPWATG